MVKAQQISPVPGKGASDPGGVGRRAGRPSKKVPREQMLRAAVQVFAEDGYESGSLQRIAMAVGIRKSSLLHRFGSKEALYLEVVALVLGRLAEMVSEAALGDREPPKRLDDLSRTITRYLGEEPFAARLLFREVMDRGPFIEGDGGAMFDMVLGTAVRFLEDGKADGFFDFEDAGDTVISVTGIHLTYFVIPALSSELVGRRIFEPAAVASRSDSVLKQVRRICGVSAP